MSDPHTRLLTLKDVANYVAIDKTTAGLNRTMRQIRHWTQCDLLRTENPKSSGSGIPRLYAEEPSVFIAAMLLEVSRYGATVDILRPLAEELYEDWEGTQEHFFFAETNEGIVYAQISWAQDPETGRFVDAQLHLFNEEEDHPEDWLKSEPSSSILVNLNQVMERVAGRIYAPASNGP